MCFLGRLFRRAPRSSSRPKETTKSKPQLCSTADRKHATKRSREHRPSKRYAVYDPEVYEPLLAEQKSSRASSRGRRDPNRASGRLRGHGVKRDPPAHKKPAEPGNQEFRARKRLPKHQDRKKSPSRPADSSRARNGGRSQHPTPANSRRRRDPSPRSQSSHVRPSSHRAYYHTAPQQAFAIRAATDRDLERAHREAQRLQHGWPRDSRTYDTSYRTFNPSPFQWDSSSPTPHYQYTQSPYAARAGRRRA